MISRRATGNSREMFRVLKARAASLEWSMKRSTFTEQQIAFALSQAQTGTKFEEICRKIGIFQATLFRWKKVYGGLMPSELRRLKRLGEKNIRLHKLVADFTFDKEMLTEVIRKI